MTVRRTDVASARRRLVPAGIVLAAILPVGAWAQAPNTATPLLPPTRQYPNAPIQSEPLAPPPGAASPSLTGPGSPPGTTPTTPGSTTAPGTTTPGTTTPGTVPPQGTAQPGSGEQPPGTQPQAGPGQQPPAEPPPPNPWVPRQQAVIQVLDKPDAQSKTLTIKVGELATYRSLTVAVQACLVRPPDVPQNATAFLVITDKHPDQPGFKGWMFANDPSLNMLQNPIYDVRVKGCTP